VNEVWRVGRGRWNSSFQRVNFLALRIARFLSFYFCNRKRFLRKLLKMC
jgi:hypothetical protein